MQNFIENAFCFERSSWQSYVAFLIGIILLTGFILISVKIAEKMDEKDEKNDTKDEDKEEERGYEC